MRQLKLKQKYSGIKISKQVALLGTVFFDASNTDKKDYETYYNLGFEELFEDEEKEVQSIRKELITLNNYFDKIFCINLKRRDDKWKECEAEFARTGLNVERFEAIDSKERNISPKDACSLSHIAILKMQITNRWNKILILEDDCQFNNNFDLKELNDFNQLIEFIPPDWEMLYLGGNNVEPPFKINDYVGKVRKTYTTSSYGITLNFATKILPRIERLDDPIDVMYHRFQRVSQCFILTPPLCWQRPGYSDIEEGFQDYDFMRS